MAAFASRKNEGVLGRICVQCLRCGHSGTIRESDLPRHGEEPGAPIARFVKRLVCQECGSHSVKAFRMNPSRRA
jgi:RNase P subunit RPR2